MSKSRKGGGIVQKRLILRSARKYWDLYLILLPTVVYFIVFKYLPMVGLTMAFNDYMPNLGYFKSPYVGLGFFYRFFSSYFSLTIIFNTLTLSALNLLFTFPLPIVLALLLNEMRAKRYKKLVQTVTYAPHFLSTVVVVGMVTAFCSPSTGVVNDIIKFFGGEPIYFMAKENWFRPLYVISEVWSTMGWNSIIFLSALTGIDQQMYEAARIDGASRLQTLNRITFPSILPTVSIMLIINCGHVMSLGFEKVYLMQTDLNLNVSRVISTYVYEQGILKTETSYSTAIGLMNSVVNFILVVTVNAISRKVGEVSLW
ncbi:MAG: ABC transporter permease subunit [Clostridiales bacterium]|nr:ABC transporter permease subunit [Clostridiales bacterium]